LRKGILETVVGKKGSKRRYLCPVRPEENRNDEKKHLEWDSARCELPVYLERIIFFEEISAIYGNGILKDFTKKIAISHYFSMSGYQKK
jgi:hypothetical protein